MRRRHRETFTTIKTEGNLLPVDLLQRIAEGDRDLDGLTSDSYHLTKNERLNEVINRAWSRCEGAWRGYRSDAEKLPDSDAGTTLTRERWLLPLFQELGYGRLLTSKSREIDGKSYPISHNWHHTPVHLVTFRQDLDRRTAGVAGAARMSPHSLVQEYLNRSDEHLWGVVSNGLRLRLLRDNASLTRHAYVEFDLEGMMSGETYSDFILLFMLLHQSRVEAETPEQCWLERWTQEAQRQGTRALDQLRGGVEQAIKTFGQGFIEHPANAQLRQKLQSGQLTTHELYQQLLRLVYRMIFLFVAEDRNLLLLSDTSPEARKLYLDHYSITRIRRIAGRLRGTRHGDLWHGLRITFRCLRTGEPALGIDPLGGFLFSEEALSDLNDCELSNDALLTAVRHLSFTQDKRVLRPVDYRNLGTEELGSVYESLLELHPEVNVSAYTFDLKVAAGSERKTTGSYYTPTSLINCLLDSALEPVIQNALKKSEPEKALLDLKVVDPACGSGHFLIAAAHRIAKHLAIIRTEEAEPAPEERRKALRDVVSRCIYGVDVNPLAVELCKVALWIETLDPGRPLGFLDHHVKCGNSLIGATPELLENGIPDDAFKPVEADDKEIAAAIRKKNRDERRGEQDLFAGVTATTYWQEAVEGYQAWGSMPENAFYQVCEKAAQYETLRDKPAYQHEKQVADLWTAAFFWPLTEETVTTVPTEDLFWRFQDSNHQLKENVRLQLQELAIRHRFFHWHLEFPEVFTDGDEEGFDCVLGNPPWEKVKPHDREFFQGFGTLRFSLSDSAKEKKEQKKRLLEDPSVAKKYSEYLQDISKLKNFFKYSSVFISQGKGDVNLYKLFCERNMHVIRNDGFAGMVLPGGLLGDSGTKDLRSKLFSETSALKFIRFNQWSGIFEGVAQKICLIKFKRGRARASFEYIPELQHIEQLNQAPIIEVDKRLVEKVSPKLLSIPDISGNEDVTILSKIHRSPSLSENYKIKSEIHMTNDSGFFVEKNEGLGIWDGTQIYALENRRFPKTYINPKFFEKKFSYCKRLICKTIVRDIIPDSARKIYVSVLPGNEATSYALRCIINKSDNSFTSHCWIASFLSSVVMEWRILRIVSGIHVSTVLPDVPIPLSEKYPKICTQIVGRAARLICTEPEFSKLWENAYTDEWPETIANWPESASRKQWSYDCGITNVEERRKTLADIDALCTCAYGLTKEELIYILDPSEIKSSGFLGITFGMLKSTEKKKYGHYLTKHMILKSYDAMAEAMKTGRPYQTILDPPPADPRVVHPPRRTRE